MRYLETLCNVGVVTARSVIGSKSSMHKSSFVHENESVIWNSEVIRCSEVRYTLNIWRVQSVPFDLSII